MSWRKRLNFCVRIESPTIHASFCFYVNFELADSTFAVMVDNTSIPEMLDRVISRLPGPSKKHDDIH